MTPIWLSEADVVALVDLHDAVEALERTLPLEPAGQAQNLSKTYTSWGDGHTLHALGATVEGAGLVGAKVWAHADGASPLLALWDARSGDLRAVIEAFALGQLRTAAVSAVATRWLAPLDADELAIIGTGKQALPQVAAVAAVRSLRRLRVFSPTAWHREAFAERVRATGIVGEVVVAGSIEEAVAGAPVITLATRATSPCLSSVAVGPGVHINAIGAIVPARAELGADLFARCDLPVADDVAAARRLAREFRAAFGEDDQAWAAVRSLGEIVAARQGREASMDLTIFKAMGMGLSDLAVGIEIYERARDRGVGRSFATPARAQPRLWRDVAPLQDASKGDCHG